VKPLQLSNHNSLEEYLENNQNKTQYVVMFCHEYWDEKLGFESYYENMTHPEMPMEVKNTEFDWYLPC
jgi:hypothetical protein